MFYTFWCHITNVPNKNNFVSFFVYLDVTWIKIFDIDYIIEKEVRTIFDIDFFFPAYLYTNTIISMEFLIHASYNN